MRYSETELTRMACTANNPVMQGKLYYKGIQQGKLRPVRELQGQAFREREFRLQGNFLFYYRVNDDKRALEPLGALCLERYTVQRELNADKGFLFSIAFQDDREKKHYLLASSGQLCDQWVSAIRAASYEQLKATQIMLQSKIKRLKDMSKDNAPQKQFQQQQQQQAKPITAPSRPPPPRPKQPPLQPKRNAPPPPAAKVAAASSSSTQETAAEGLLLDFS